MHTIRLATTEEVEALKDHSDLQFAQAVYSFGSGRATYRLAPEVDPVDYGSLSNSEKRAFMTLLEGHMRLSGLQAYYFNVPANEEFAQYRKVVETWGAQKVSLEPEFRYKKSLNVNQTAD